MLSQTPSTYEQKQTKPCHKRLNGTIINVIDVHIKQSKPYGENAQI